MIMLKKGLTGNQLKIIAMLTMTIDHVGMVLFPQHLWLRLVGRLAFPIYAFMIAEGCDHTRSMPRYLGTMAAMAALWQIINWFFLDSLYQCILVTFSLSIGVIWLSRKARDTKKPIWMMAAIAAVLVAGFITEVLPRLLPKTDFMVDYGFWGVMLPFMVWAAKDKWQKLLLAVLTLILIASDNYLQLFSLAAVPLLALYNGQRGKWKMKLVFYFYYPMHLVVIYGIAYLL
jgi:hypothetical protein